MLLHPVKHSRPWTTSVLGITSQCSGSGLTQLWISKTTELQGFTQFSEVSTVCINNYHNIKKTTNTKTTRKPKILVKVRFWNSFIKVHNVIDFIHCTARRKAWAHTPYWKICTFSTVFVCENITNEFWSL